MNAEEILRCTTVVIPAFNEERALGVLLAELREQFPDLPVTVVDDGITCTIPPHAVAFVTLPLR